MKNDNIRYIVESAKTRKERKIKRKKMKLINQIEKETNRCLTLRKKKIHEHIR